MKRKYLTALLTLVVGTLAVLGGILFKQSISLRKEKNTYRVVQVFDGDSFSIPPDQTIRLAKLNAPELKFCFGREAKENLEKLILGKRVGIKKIGKDSFNRIIALVYLEDQLVNETVIENGWAKYTSGGAIKENELITERLKRKGREAKKNKRGVWSEKCYQMTNIANPKCNIKGNLGKHEHGEKKTYHYPGCSEYNRVVVELDLGEQWFCSEKEARAAGYQKSKHCFRPYKPTEK